MDKICGNCDNWDLCRRREPGELYCQKHNEWVLATTEGCRYFRDLPMFGGYDKKKRSTEAINEAKTHCFITTAIVHILGMADDCELLKTMRSLRSEHMQNNPEYRGLLVQYDVVGPIIADSLLRDERRMILAYAILYELQMVEKLAKLGMIKEAVDGYVAMTRSLMAMYGISYVVGEEIEESYDQKNGGHGSFTITEKKKD